jgi:4-hydroxy-tetrahydrodipicolinate synthase
MSYQWKGRWTGVNVPTFTIFTPDFKVDYNATRLLFRHLVESKKIAGIAVNVHTGEGEVLTIEERKKIIEIAKDEIKGKIPLTTGIHADTHEEGVRQAKEMEKTGVDALMILAPNIYLYDAREDPECGIEYHKAVAKAVNLPIVMHQVYGTPHEYPTDAFAKMFREIDNLVAVKLATGWQTAWFKFEDDLRAIREIPRDNISLFPGSITLAALLSERGLTDGAWTGSGNFACEELSALFEASRQGNIKEIENLHYRIRLVEDSLIEKPMVKLITRYKEIAYMLGLIPSATVRPPKMPLSDQEKRRLREVLGKAQMLPAK